MPPRSDLDLRTLRPQVSGDPPAAFVSAVRRRRLHRRVIRTSGGLVVLAVAAIAAVMIRPLPPAPDAPDRRADAAPRFQAPASAATLAALQRDWRHDGSLPGTDRVSDHDASPQLTVGDTGQILAEGL